MAFNLGDALKGVSELGTGREQIEYIRLDLIDSDPNNFYQLSDIDELAANIELCGLQQPIRLRLNPENTERYIIVSGHRRRAAIELLAKDNPEKWDEVACIVSRDVVSPALQQLQLILANSNTRKMSDAEISKQAEQTEKLLCQLKEEEGYEFPGRMRDHVAEIVGVSKSKLARLKVIRERLDDGWQPAFKKGKLNESVAYELAQMPKADQAIILQARGDNGCLDAKQIKAFRERFVKIDAATCKGIHKGEICHNTERKKIAIASESPWSSFYCDKCCDKCPNLTSCKYVCPALATKAAQLRADKRAARKKEIAAEREAERPKTEKVSAIWHRFGLERSISGKSVKDVKDAMGDYCFSDDPQKYGAYESGAKSVTPATKLPYGMYLYDAARLIDVADLFGCSVDYLLCRTDVKEMAQAASTVSESGADEPQFIPGAWYPATVEPPVGVRLILIDSDWFVDSGKYIGCGEYSMDYGSPVAWWTLEPNPANVATDQASVAGWRVGTPEVNGKYAAYVKLEGVKGPMLRELYWNGEWWAMHNERIADEVTVVCWADRPDF